MMNFKKSGVARAVSMGTYRIINRDELTEEQMFVLRAAGRERVVERLCSLLGDGKLSFSQVQAKYGKLMNRVGRS